MGIQIIYYNIVHFKHQKHEIAKRSIAFHMMNEYNFLLVSFFVTFFLPYFFACLKFKRQCFCL
jgi:hypothetical protein